MTKPKAPSNRVKAGTAKASAEDRKRMFVEAYMSNGQNATAAALAAGYSKGGAAKQGYRMSKDPAILSMLDKRRADVLDRLMDSTERTLLETARIAFSDIGKTIGPDGRVLLPNELDDDTRAAVKSFKIDEYGRVEYTFWDKNNANDRIHRQRNLFRDDNKGKQPLTQVAVIRLAALQPLDNGRVIDGD